MKVEQARRYKERGQVTDEIQDPEFLNFAVENISELFGYLATGRVNIRICREDGPPKSSAGKSAPHSFLA